MPAVRDDTNNTMLSPSSYNRFLEISGRGKTTWWRYLLSCILAFLIAIILGVVITVCLQALHWFPNNFADEILQPSHPLVFFVGTGVLFGTLVIGLIVAIAVLQDKSFGDVVGRWNWNLFCWGVAIWAAVMVLASGLDFLIAPHSFNFTATKGTLDLALWALLGLSVQTFAEEFIFRGYLTQAFLLLTKNPFAAALICGLLFGAMPVHNGAPQAVSAACFGNVTTLIAIRMGGIAFTFGLHLMNNLFGAVIIISADDVFRGSPGLISQNTPQLDSWDVGVTAAALLGTLWLTTRLAISCRSSLRKS